MRPMPTSVRRQISGDLHRANSAARSGDLDVAWTLLEECHVLSQPWAWPHVCTHLRMFALAVRTADVGEGLGQLTRVVVAAPGSLVGRYPVGNSGRARVSMFAPMPVPPRLERLLKES